MTDVYVSAHTVSVHIGRPPPEVFDFITTCSSWPRWHPATVSVAGAVDHPAREGEVIVETVSYTHLRAHETVLDLVCRLLLEKQNSRGPE